MAIGFRSLQYRALAIALLATAPWVAIASPFVSSGFLGLCAIVSVSAVLMLHYALRPAAQAARLLRDARNDPSADEETDGVVLLAETRRLLDRLEALDHRWVRRHAITGLPIRESLLERIEAHVSADAGRAFVGAIRFADYKRLAAFDPHAAEVALKVFAERLALSLGKERLLAHVDRDCFALFFEQSTPDAAQREMSALCYAMGAEIEAEGLALIPEIEAGGAIFPDDADSAVGLLNHALVMLSRVGEGSEAACAEASTADVARERFVIEQGLRLAIQRHELELHFQPVIDLSRGLLIGAEALLRWRHPQVGLIAPATFVPVLEDSDLTREIGLWTLNAACSEVKAWNGLGLGHLKVAVNFSGRQLGDLNLKDAVERTLNRHGLAPGSLEIELTETASAKDAERARHLFGQLRAIGVSIAIDDFGTGYSSLSYLKNLPFDKLKIDREFVQQVHLRRDSRAICHSLIELSRGLGIAVLAEGVETIEEVETLQKLGCHLFQGFYFSKPLNAQDFIRYAVHRDGRSGREDARGQLEMLRQGMR
ncbi:bifunctional diguanylate cyclase/phosphodiesterase [Sphingosinicella sp. CPCC 101087]|uniref:putative bifunctional diguanylate cyclase/phosphodiesterase n=1 Tax=Sphingosinicella sp. CPCC 101087 TaxID=2497754 RepID=UPI00101DA0B1|nr:GGDEF domain-containing phosphodiesterase [Sphingosinicella sp. CPCC 101087]